MTTIINADNGVVSGSAGLKTSADSTGILELQTNSTTAVTVSTGQDVSFTKTVNTPNTFSFKNRIINGDMRIDQRAVGVETRGTATSGATYTVDRWYTIKNGAGQAFTVQKSSDVPANQIFKNSVLITITETDSVISTGEYNVFGQNIEGLNISDLLWGTANAKAITLSFWVKSSLTGTFAVVLGAQGTNVYPASFTINTANTWEYKSITIPGPTSGTFPVDNTSAIQVRYDLGIGSQYSAPLNAWISGGNYFGGTGAVKLSATNGATFQVTGVQFEIGNQATSFDVRSYGTELALCQRYYNKLELTKTLVYATTTTYAQGNYRLPVTMRAAPTSIATNATNMNELYVTNITGTYVPSSSCDTDSVWVVATNTGGTAFTANHQYRFNTPGCSIDFSSEI